MATTHYSSGSSPVALEHPDLSWLHGDHHKAIPPPIQALCFPSVVVSWERRLPPLPLASGTVFPEYLSVWMWLFLKMLELVFKALWECGIFKIYFYFYF